MSDKINHPKHYGGADDPYEAIKVIEAWDLGFCLGNTVKYISRAGKKAGEGVIDDLRKAKWYLEREIQRLEEVEESEELPAEVAAKQYCVHGAIAAVCTFNGCGHYAR